ncbi:hypothetical protein PHISCL_09865, partial [Aspergillus sclerotialis]
MDFPGGSITNVNVIDGFSNIYWRIYTEEPSVKNNPPEAPANGYTILKHLSRLKDLELRLRSLDCLVSCYPRRLGLWVFSPTPEFERLQPFCPKDAKDDPNRILIGSSILKASASGNISSVDLVKHLSADPGVYSQRSLNTPTSSRRVDGNFAAIYASFMTAVTGTISLQLIRRNGAIPLGSRTLFTAVERDGYSSSVIANDSPVSIPSLTTLQIQLTPAGKLTICLPTVAQIGITRLLGLWDQTAEISDAESGTDLWLAPNGTIARLVTGSPDTTGVPSPNIPIGNPVKRIQWKSTVLEWLEKFGLSVKPIDEEVWVEVEVLEPFYAKLVGDTWRQNHENQLLPLMQILWPARYCFRRAKSMPLDDTSFEDPVDFAVKWYEMASSLPERTEEKPVPGSQPEKLKDQSTSPSKPEFPEIESLARMAEYQDVQSASLVYPTPPDGPIAVALNPLNASEPSGAESDMGMSQLPKEEKGDNDQSSKDHLDTDIAMDFGPSAGLAVGSGLYDTNEDDDLFGDMNVNDFGTKGITDADFNFFDDPGFDEMGEETPAGNIQETPKAEPEPQPQSTTDHKAAEMPSAEVQPAADTPDFDPTDLPGQPQQEVTNNRIPPDNNTQTISPPLSPVEVRKILFPGSDPGREGQKQYHYSPVIFDRNVSDWGRKYGSEGKFWFSTATAAPVNSTSDIPTIGIPSRRKNKALGDASRPNDHATPSTGKSLVRSVSPSSSDTSSEDDQTESENESLPAVFNPLKRKRARSNSESSAARSLGVLSRDVDQETNKVENSTFLGNFLSAFSDWPLTGYFSASQAAVLPVLIRKEDHVQIAQLLADQITQSSFNHSVDGRIGISDLENETHAVGTSLDEVRLMGEIQKLDLKGYSSLHDSDNSPLPSDGVMSHNTPRKEGCKGLILKVPPPHLRVRRGKDFLEALPPVVSFWETFGIEPAHGPKDISAYCIHPYNVLEPADAFLESFGLLYSSCNLGAHVRGDRSKSFERGLASWDTKSSGVSGYSNTMESLKTLCEELGSALFQNQSGKENIVIYIVNPFTHSAALADICAAFWCLIQTYAANVDNQQTHLLDELVLQIIPLSFIASPEFIAVPSQAEYLSLALEVYSRCPPKDPGSNLVKSAPPTLMAESLPKNINFKLTGEQLSPFLEGKTLHVAYSRSLDQRWVTAAWADNTGSIQCTLSYCLRYRNSKAGRSITDIRKEIWNATRDIMERIQARWRVIVVNTEPLDQEEID